ncbi:hypothetical protein RF11_08321 [Thelohanellus kitauei]|uniref:Uncharacterized protein n=1 Tax=Thelohanellus kitauei TaxID=669202 RepID=A0A0C2N265_THEKT|nr:hypothetical protein RF11_08321 [Thelohanellus kitauei]
MDEFTKTLIEKLKTTESKFLLVAYVKCFSSLCKKSGKLVQHFQNALNENETNNVYEVFFRVLARLLRKSSVRENDKNPEYEYIFQYLTQNLLKITEFGVRKLDKLISQNKEDNQSHVESIYLSLVAMANVVILLPNALEKYPLQLLVKMSHQLLVATNSIPKSKITTFLRDIVDFIVVTGNKSIEASVLDDQIKALEMYSRFFYIYLRSPTDKDALIDIAEILDRTLKLKLDTKSRLNIIMNVTSTRNPVRQFI